MAMPQRDNTIEAIKRLALPSRVRCGVSGALLDYAVMYGNEANASAKKGPAGALVLRKVAAVAGRPSCRREDECGIISP